MILHKKKKIALAASSFLISFVLIEVFLRTCIPPMMEHDRMFEYDSELGWRFIPEKKWMIFYRDVKRHTIHINRMGFRDNPPPTNEDHVQKIAVFGDSFVSNVSVEDNEVFTEILEQRLNDVAVLNLGVNGYGQVQQYLLLEKWLERIQPDLVIVMVYLRNDFKENIGGYWLYPRPIASWDQQTSSLELFPPSRPKQKESKLFWNILLKSHFCYLLVGQYNKMADHLKNPTNYKPSIYTPPELYLCRSELTEDTEIMYKVMEALLLKIASFIKQKGTSVVFVLAPSKVQVESDLWTSMLDEYHKKTEDYIRTLPNDRLMQLAQENQLLMIDLLPKMRSETKRDKSFYNRYERHWNAEGNRFTANVLFDYLEANNLLSDKASPAKP